MQDRTEYMKRYRLENKERIKELNNRYYQDNKDNLKENFREYYIKTRNRRRELGKIHYEENKSFYLAYSKIRKATIKRSCPNSLLEDDYYEIKQIYLKCKEITDTTGIIHHVDHIVPLNGKTVCGLHVPWNLQILTAEENLRKSNKYE
jgi:5-methylcytosine-specific restriction endonuclease McrA